MRPREHCIISQEDAHLESPARSLDQVSRFPPRVLSLVPTSLPQPLFPGICVAEFPLRSLEQSVLRQRSFGLLYYRLHVPKKVREYESLI